MTKDRSKIPLVLIVMLLASLACNSSAATEEPGQPAAPVPTNTATATPPAEAVIQHNVIPGSLPENASDHAGDYDSSVTASQKKSNGGDRFTFERFERPFNANTMDVYFPELDIVDTNLYQDATWIFSTVQVKDRSAANTSPYRFAMQVDIQVDGKGDYLVVANNPSSTDWTTDGVQVYFDTNNDVGDLSAMFTDEESASNGFETTVFDNGKGDDPDTAWVRVSPQDANVVEFALKRSVIGAPESYLIDLWAGHSLLDPTLFDYSDHYTHEQAGAADPGFPIFYPIKSVYAIDNSCRMAYGFQPTGYEPGICEQPLAAPPAAGPGGCTASTTQILACSIIGGTWNPSTCTCTPPTPIPPPK